MSDIRGWTWLWLKQERSDAEAKLPELVVMGTGYASEAKCHDAIRLDASKKGAHFAVQFGDVLHGDK